MTSKKQILKIAIQTPLHQTFDYLPSVDAENQQYYAGQRVIVPFGRRTMIGIIVDIVTKTDFIEEKLKPIISTIEDNPVIDRQLLKLLYWASRYYCHSIGDVILSALPKSLRQGKSLVLKEKKQTALTNATTDVAVQLTHEQIQVIDAITSVHGFQPYLLAGVTGSGKTEVYMRVIASALAREKQALVLVPEIALTPQTVSRFEARFSVPILLLHSGLGDSARLRAWLKASEQKPCIVIGTRSAVFAPLQNLGVIVVDEEHDLSFKQQSRFRYHARDVAVMRAKLADVPIILGSATPSLESYYNVKCRKYALLKLSSRPGQRMLPNVVLHDVRSEKLESGLSPYLLKEIKKHLAASGQVLIYLNRRGYAPLLICHHCGWTANCNRCDAKLTVHQHPQRLVCHHCGFQKKLPKICESCQQSEVIVLGLGTEQLENTLKTLFPDKNILRVDRDNVRTYTALKKTLAQVHEHAADILIGTQLLVKGHHFEKVSLVAAIDVDHALFSSDFRAIERLGQSLVQVAGRAGRNKKQGEVIIQTHQPDHPQLEKLFSGDYLTFADDLLAERQLTQLPPFQHAVVIRAEARTQEKVMNFLTQLKKGWLQCENRLEVSGPMPAILSKKADMFRANLYLQSVDRKLLHQTMMQMVSYLSHEKIAAVRWIIDVDPMESD